MNGYLYLFFQIWVWILASFILGWVSHWFLCCKVRNGAASEQESTLGKSKLTNKNIEVVASAPQTVEESWKPLGLPAPPKDRDDLKRIKGVGPVIEETLNELGIYQFEQIANWNDNNVSWIENFLAFPGRIDRENWIEQSNTLNAGGTTEFAKRVDKGDIDYS